MNKQSSRPLIQAGIRAGRFLGLTALIAAAAACMTPQQSPSAGAAESRATTSQSGASSAPAPSADSAAAQAPKAVKPAEQTAPTPGPPATELTRELLFQILASEIAAQRGQFSRASATYLKIARETGDARLAHRATELALAGRSIEAALPAAELWHELEPGSALATQTLETLWVSTGRLAPAEPLLRERLAQARADGSIADVYQKLQGLLARVADRSAALALLDRLAAPDQKLAQARLAQAALASAADNPQRALREARAAMALKPKDAGAAIAAARYAQQGAGGSAAARSILVEFLRSNPRATEARFVLARLFAADKMPREARAQFEAALANDPDNPVILFSLAQLAYQTKQPALAEEYLKRYVRMPAAVRRDNDQAYLFLGQLADDDSRHEQAIGWYARIKGGEQFLPAVIRRAMSLGKLGRIDEARALLRNTAVSTDAERVQLRLTEAQVLREAKRNQDAFDTLAEALAAQPDNQDLLYDQAMVAEKLDRIDLLESNLRRVIMLRPDNAHAYNALGYTLADRSQRLDEARTLIEKALSLAPDDAHIEDSMGWVLFRQGKFDEAEKYLRSAYARRPEAEIAAHLGEVLWAQGRRDEARQLWQEASGREPDNAILKATLTRLNVAL